MIQLVQFVTPIRACVHCAGASEDSNSTHRQAGNNHPREAIRQHPSVAHSAQDKAVERSRSYSHNVAIGTVKTRSVKYDVNVTKMRVTLTVKYEIDVARLHEAALVGADWRESTDTHH